ncbi:MAG: flagellar hook-length control protein FliK [Melioribacter sp.]|nr:flagellar hook-length control protein FliK [Melioribacter sp.]
MNLNPLFFNKISKDSIPFNPTFTGIGEQTYLFADIINVTTEELNDVNPDAVQNPLDLVLSSVNDIDIEIPINDGLMNQLKLIINESSARIESINKEIYQLDDASLTKTDTIINEESLLAFIAGINQVINTGLNKLTLVNDVNSLQLTEEHTGVENPDLQDELLTLDIIENELQKHHSVKFTLKSSTEKITLQISAAGDEIVTGNDLKNISTYFQNVNVKMESNEEIVSENSDLPVESNVDNNESELKSIDKNDKVNPEVSKSIANPILEVTNDPVEPVNDNTKKYQVKIVHAETINHVSRKESGIKIPFILDIKTSKEIGEFLSKYNFQDTQSLNSEESNPVLSNDKPVNNIPESNIKILNKDEVPNENKLMFIKGKEWIENDNESEPYEIKRTGSEFLRAIKIESVEKPKNELDVRLNIKNIPKEQSANEITGNENNQSDTGKEIKSGVKINTDQQPVTNTEVHDENIKSGVDAAKPNTNEPPKPKKVDAKVEFNKDEISVVSKNPEAEKTIKPNESNNASPLINDKTNIEKASNSGSGDTYKDNKEDKSLDRTKEINSKSEKFVSDDIKPDDTVAQTKINKDQPKHPDVVNHQVFEKKTVQVNELNSKIISTASAFTETVKKVKSSEIVSEINKYLNTNEKQSITFQLTPKNLGTVKLTVDYIDNALQATIEVENEQIRQTVQSNIDQLKTTLQNNGIQINNLNVNLSNGEQKAHKQFTNKRKNYGGNTDSKVEQKSDLTGKKKLGYNTYEYLV